jgi:hypothetical protein
MAYDDATTPLPTSPDHPTWPSAPPPRAWPVSRPTRQPSAFRPGCGGALAIIGAFIAGALLSALIITVLFVRPPASATSASPTGGALRVTITDAFLNDAFKASSSGALTDVQSHIHSDGTLTISGVLQGASFASGQTAVIVLEPVVSQGKLTVRAVSGSIGGVTLPGLALAPIATRVNEQLAQASQVSLGGRQTLAIQAVTFTNGEMTIIYT